jgi:hypothetical protein
VVGAIQEGIRWSPHAGRDAGSIYADPVTNF